MTGDKDSWEHLAPGCARQRIPGLDVTVGLVVGSEGVLVIDTGSTLAEGAALRLAVSALTGRAPTHVALTHGHFDHVFGTAAFPGARVYGEMSVDSYLERERLALRDDAVRHGVDPREAAEAADALVRPDHLVNGSYELDLGDDRTVLLAHLGRGHTGHDLVVAVPPSVPGTPAVIFCGDLVEESGTPQAGPDAVPQEWPSTLGRLLRLGGGTALYVPGHGAVVDARFVQEQREELAVRFGVS